VNVVRVAVVVVEDDVAIAQRRLNDGVVDCLFVLQKINHSTLHVRVSVEKH